MFEFSIATAQHEINFSCCVSKRHANQYWSILTASKRKKQSKSVSSSTDIVIVSFPLLIMISCMHHIRPLPVVEFRFSIRKKYFLLTYFAASSFLANTKHDIILSLIRSENFFFSYFCHLY